MVAFHKMASFRCECFN